MPIDSDIVIVSGLPRSGTSLMMQMLDKGGLPVLTDMVRAADVDNPRGYYEFERVKKVKHDRSWLPAARGKAVKMISQLLYELPGDERYRIIFMRRDLDEILQSQEKMLRRRNRTAAPRDQMASSFTVHVERLFQWLADQPHVSVLTVSYNTLITSPDHEVPRIVQFLDGRPCHQAMLDSIDPQLYRNRAPAVES